MLICQVVGTVVATTKIDGFRGEKLLLVQERELDGRLVGPAFVATDSIGAGSGEVVLVTRGSAARNAGPASTDAAVVAIVDTVEDAGGQASNRQWAINRSG